MILVVITKRFITLIGIGVIILGISLGLHFPIGAFIIYNGLISILLVIDYMISPSAKILDIKRIGNDKISIYENERIGFEVYNKSDRNLYIEFKDEVPDFHFKTENQIMVGYIEPHSKKEFHYEVIPTKRGAFQFGDFHGRLLTGYKLSMKQFKLPLKREYKVYPNMKNLKKYRMIIYNNRKYESGNKNLKVLGRGREFESLREYIHGDEYRTINWKATARENKPIVNQYEPEKNQHVYILIDTGRPMSYTTQGYRKLDLAINTGLVLSDVVNQNGDLSGLMTFNIDVGTIIKPNKGNNHRHNMMEALYHVEANNNTSNFREAFYKFKNKEKRRSLICIFTDFDTLEEAEDMMRVIPILSRNNIVIINLIKNEKLENLTDNQINTEEDAIKKAVSLELLNERKQIIKTLNARGIMCFESEPEKLAINTINRYLQAKNEI